jgi:hypothetical protein
MSGFAGFDHWAQVVHPVKTGLIALKSCEQTVDTVRTLTDSFCEFGPDELGSVVDRQLVPILILEEGQVFLDVVSKDQDVRVFSSDGHQFLAVEIPDFVIEVLGGGRSTFILSTE